MICGKVENNPRNKILVVQLNWKTPSPLSLSLVLLSIQEKHCCLIFKILFVFDSSIINLILCICFSPIKFRFSFLHFFFAAVFPYTVSFLLLLISWCAIIFRNIQMCEYIHNKFSNMMRIVRICMQVDSWFQLIHKCFQSLGQSGEWVLYDRFLESREGEFLTSWLKSVQE